MRRIALELALAIYVMPAAAAEPICLAGCPKGTGSDQIIERSIYTLANNAQTKFADWVAYQDRRDELGPTRPRKWKADPEIAPADTLEPADYMGLRTIGMDRGHQAPLASFAGTKDWPTANYLSNITPQKSALNEGAWEQLENQERSAVRRFEMTLYVITGPLYERPMPKLPKADEPHTIPSGYWKIIATKDQNGDISAVAFVMDQELAKDADFCKQAVSINEVEKRSKLTFFPQLSAPTASALKANATSTTLLSTLGC